jgi:hypothetical protein
MGQIDYHGHTIIWATKKIAPGRYAAILITDEHDHGIQVVTRHRKTAWRKGRAIAEWYWWNVLREIVITEARARKLQPKPRQHVQPLRTWTPRERASNEAILTKIAFTTYGA